MFRDYDKAKSMLKGSFEHILGLMDKRYVSYDEIKELMVEALYKLSKENEKVETHTVTMPQVLYGPPPMGKVETRGEMADMFDDGYIPGTNIRKPRARKSGESEDQYLSYLEKYYATYLPNNGKGKGPRK